MSVHSGECFLSLPHEQHQRHSFFHTSHISTISLPDEYASLSIVLHRYLPVTVKPAPEVFLSLLLWMPATNNIFVLSQSCKMYNGGERRNASIKIY
jgi:hypothetical protein